MNKRQRYDPYLMTVVASVALVMVACLCGVLR